MECLYNPDFTISDTEILIAGEEAKHCRALRLGDTEQILITNGQGLSAICRVKHSTKLEYIFAPNEFFENMNELKSCLGLAIGILDSRDRLEFALEKSIELGITHFFPLTTDFSQKRTLNIERLRQKSISAIKQCKRAAIPYISQPITIQEALSFDNFNNIILADEQGSPFISGNYDCSTLIFVGPEGGFSAREIELITSDSRTTKLRLTSRRLRAETAAVAALSLVACK